MSEIEDLEVLEKEKVKFFDSKCSEMKEFKQRAEIFASECRNRVKDLRDGLNEVNIKRFKCSILEALDRFCDRFYESEFVIT